GKKSKMLESVLDMQVNQDIEVYEILVEQAETCSESLAISHAGDEYDVLLVSAPIVAWTRYRLPDGRLTRAQHESMQQAFARPIAAQGARISMLPNLITFDQVPPTFQETSLWSQRLDSLAVGASTEPCPVNHATDTEGMLADARFAVAAIAVPAGQPVFRWQTQDIPAIEARDVALQSWTQHVDTLLGGLFTGCQIEVLL